MSDPDIASAHPGPTWRVPLFRRSRIRQRHEYLASSVVVRGAANSLLVRDNCRHAADSAIHPGRASRMRGRTAARNYSPAREQFRRERTRHRTWGLIQRRAQRLARQHRKSRTRDPAPCGQQETADATPPAQNSQPTHPEHSGRDHHTQTPRPPTGQRAAVTDTRPVRPHPGTPTADRIPPTETPSPTTAHNTGARFDQRATKIHGPPVRQAAVKNRKSASQPNRPRIHPLSTPDSGQHLRAHPQGVKCGTSKLSDRGTPRPRRPTQAWAGRAPRRVGPRERRSGPRRTSRQLKASDSLE